MIQVTARTRILVAVQPADFRCGTDGLARLCREALAGDPFTGAVLPWRPVNASDAATALEGSGVYR